MGAVNGTLKTVASLVVRAHRLVPALFRRDRDAVKALSSHVVFAGRPSADVNAAGLIFCDKAVTWLRDDTLALLREHQARGDDVVLVSASFQAYLRPLGERLGVTAVIGSKLVVDQAGCCTGALDGGNCRGEEKVVRL